MIERMTAPFTSAECRASMRALEDEIANYAELLVCDGVAIKPGQELVVNAPVEAYEFARLVVKAGYEAGAGHVTVIWGDERITRLEYENLPREYFETVPAWKRDQLNTLAEDGAAFLFLSGEDPSALKGIDPAKPATALRARNMQCRAFRDGMDFGRNAWCIGGVPVAAWARQVFPDVSEEEALYRLWAAILRASRADGEDPHGAWETHNAAFEKNKRQRNGMHFESLHYTSSNGTDLIVGLTDKHIWEGGAARTQDGTAFFPNIPTEEVFTSPDCRRTQGRVVSALPLVHNGLLVSDFWFEFKDGRVVDFGAERGASVLEEILETDDGARRLGECAIISKNTPIRQSGLIFYNTLYDENASCHLALGMGFPDCYEGGYEMTAEELAEKGVNKSHTHVDFMIGSDDLAITGITADGKEVPFFINGQWAWE